MLVGGEEEFVRFTVTVMDPEEVLDKTNASFPVVGSAAVDSSTVLLDVEVSSVDPGRMNRLKFPIA